MPEDVSQRRLESEYGTKITDKADECLSTSIFGQVCCWIDISEKDIPGTGGGGTGRISEINVVGGGWCGTTLDSGWDRASATTFFGPGRWWTSQLNSDRKDNLLCCMSDQGGDVLNKAYVNGL